MLHYSKKSDHKQEVMASQKYAGNGRSSHCNSGQASTAWVCDVCGFSFNGKFNSDSAFKYATAIQYTTV